MSYQNKTGTLSAGAHPGGCNGQDAYNDMLVTEKLDGGGENMGNIKNVTHDIVGGGSGERTSGVGLQGCADNCDEEEYIVRRLTPTECARLQGFPNDWCADVPHTDAQEYKMWGNGIALNCILPMMQNIAAVLSE